VGGVRRGLPLRRAAAREPRRGDRSRAGGPGGRLDREDARRAALARNLAEDARGLQAELEREIRAPRRLADWLLGDDGFAPTSPGLLRYLGWKAAARALRPLVGAFGGWREEERWMRNYCPTCGSKPAMAQLLGTDPGRKRFLSCGCCRTRWQYGRTRCPFCEQDSHRLGVVAVAKEGGLRIDYCESCRGYLKTLEGQADEELLLSDWSSLHLDLVAHDRGLKRLAVSLYDLEPILQT
jgi:FdhE protein